MARAGEPPGPFASNRKKLEALMEEAGLEALVLAGKPNMVYATGIREPSGAVVLSHKCGNTLIAPLLDYSRIAYHAPKEFDVKAAYRGGEEPIKADMPRNSIVHASPLKAAFDLLKSCLGSTSKVGLDLDWTTHQVTRDLAGVEYVDFSDTLRKARSIKSPEEIDAIVEAQRIAEKALSRVLGSLREGFSEAEGVSEIVREVLALGGWDTAFPPIVAFYENTAFPHHTSGQIALSKPGPVLVDLGAIYKGYHSDMTRTTWWGRGDGAAKSFKEKLETVLEAMLEAIDTVRPGVKVWEVDKAARQRLAKEGLDKYFIHGLGHGVGLEIHETPYLRPGSREELDKGMVITIEPGIYIAGLYGIRIEDLVLVTERGRKILTTYSRLIET
ncbi:MAG: Xaa-Pro peptidase family protein [Desulfurococcales archaeon]|nr:Xaa-Pro peptidase family protein [Desulfurococcales archaeon]